MQLSRWLLVVALASTACGKSNVENDAGCVGGSEATSSPGADASSANTCRTPSSVRLCGGGCPSLSTTECPGLGCVPVVDRTSGAQTGVGVCLADLPIPVETCWFCRDGMTCVHLEGQGPLCVAEDVCAALEKLGAGTGCRYADFSPYDGRPLAVATCPNCPEDPTGGITPLSCGPGCGSCGDLNNCFGRSADFGYGICITQFKPCSVNEPRDEFCKVCATWLPVQNGDELALDYGNCVHESYCDFLEASGRISCHRK